MLSQISYMQKVLLKYGILEYKLMIVTLGAQFRLKCPFPRELISEKKHEYNILCKCSRESNVCYDLYSS